MSETPPVPPDAERPAGPKLVSITLGIACTLIAVVIGGVIVVSPTIDSAPLRDWNSDHLILIKMSGVIMGYTLDHKRYPPTLSALDTGTTARNASLGFWHERKKEGFDWIYFPKERLGDSPDDTILLAEPGVFIDDHGQRSRLVMRANFSTGKIPDADFQRLIREQNPPAASSSPDR